MKKLFTILTLILLTFANSLQAQVVDSIAINLMSQSTDSVTWTFYKQNIDSFSLGKIKTHFGRTWINNTWENEWLYNYTFSATVDSVTWHKWNGQWDNYFRYTYFHDAQGLDTLIHGERWFGGWINQTRWQCTYNADSSLATRINSSWNTTTSQWELYTYEYWSKDSLQRDTSVTTDKYNSGVWEPWRRESFTYDSLGNRITAVGNFWDTTDSLYWLTYHTNSWTYDSLNRVIKSTDGDIPGGHGHTYYWYYPDNNISDLWGYWDQSSGETWTHTHYYNDLANTVYAILPDDYSICENDTIPIGGFAFGGQQPLQFSWTPSNGLSSDTIENPTLIADTSTTYFYTVTDANNVTVTDSIHINVNTAPVVDSVLSLPSSCVGCADGSFFIYTTSMINSYSISPDPGAIFVGNEITGLPSGIYTICMVSTDGCTTCIVDSISFSIGIPEASRQEIFISTNPFSIYTDIHCSMTHDKMMLEIFDGLGRKVSAKKITTPDTRIYRDDLKSGVYYGIIYGDEKVLGRVKLVVVD